MNSLLSQKTSKRQQLFECQGHWPEHMENLGGRGAVLVLSLLRAGAESTAPATNGSGEACEGAGWLVHQAQKIAG